MMKNGYKNTYVSGPGNIDTSTEFWSTTYKPYIRTITFGNDLSNLPSSCTNENLCWDISYDANQNKKVYGYLVDSGLTFNEVDSSTSTTTKPLYNLYIVSEAPIFAPADCKYIFSFYKMENNKYKSNLAQINFNNCFNTSKVTNMTSMFDGCSSLTTLDLSSFNTSNVTNMTRMFSGCSSLTTLDLSSFNTSKVTNMSGYTSHSGMFSDCLSLTSLDLSNFNTSNVTDMRGLFHGCSSLMSLDLSNFNTSKVTNMQNMFSSCSSLTSLDVSNFNTSNVTNMSSMFNNCKKLQTQINITNTGTTSYSRMFSDALTDANAYIILGYTTDTQSIAEAMKSTCANSSKITLKQV